MVIGRIVVPYPVGILGWPRSLRRCGRSCREVPLTRRRKGPTLRNCG